MQKRARPRVPAAAPAPGATPSSRPHPAGLQHKSGACGRVRHSRNICRRSCIEAEKKLADAWLHRAKVPPAISVHRVRLTEKSPSIPCQRTQQQLVSEGLSASRLPTFAPAGCRQRLGAAAGAAASLPTCPAAPGWQSSCCAPAGAASRPARCSPAPAVWRIGVKGREQ